MIASQCPVSGGRTLNVLVSGPADGLALVFHTGTPSGLAVLRPMTDAAAARGLRTVQYARPGSADRRRTRAGGWPTPRPTLPRSLTGSASIRS